MPETLETSVLVVGAGPVGLTLAMDLARRGVSVLVPEAFVDEARALLEDVAMVDEVEDEPSES